MRGHLVTLLAGVFVAACRSNSYTPPHPPPGSDCYRLLFSSWSPEVKRAEMDWFMPADVVALTRQPIQQPVLPGSFRVLPDVDPALPGPLPSPSGAPHRMGASKCCGATVSPVFDSCFTGPVTTSKGRRQHFLMPLGACTTRACVGRRCRVSKHQRAWAYRRSAPPKNETYEAYDGAASILRLVKEHVIERSGTTRSCRRLRVTPVLPRAKRGERRDLQVADLMEPALGLEPRTC